MFKPQNTEGNLQVLRHDSDARFTRKGFIGYKVHRMVDHKYGIILSDIATAGNVPDPNVVPDIIRDFKQVFKIQHKYLVEDSGYRDQYILNFTTNMGYDVYLPIYKNNNAKNKEMFESDKFLYSKERNVLVCPEGKELKFKRNRSEKGVLEFKASAKECNSCLQKQKCTSSDRGRTSSILVHEELITELINKMGTRKYRVMMKKRQVYSEGSFSEAKEVHGMDKARFQGAEKVNIQALMTSMIQNIKKFVKYTQKSKTGNERMANRGEVQVFLVISPQCIPCFITYMPTRRQSLNYMGESLAV
jgi:hypothetical protein